MALVQMADAEMATMALMELNGTVLRDPYSLRVSFSNSKLD